MHVLRVCNAVFNASGVSGNTTSSSLRRKFSCIMHHSVVISQVAHQHTLLLLTNLTPRLYLYNLIIILEGKCGVVDLPLRRLGECVGQGCHYG